MLHIIQGSPALHQQPSSSSFHTSSLSPALHQQFPSSRFHTSITTVLHLPFSSPYKTAAWLRPLQSRCCSGALSPNFSCPAGVLPLPHHGCYPSSYSKPLGTHLHGAPALVAVEGHPGKDAALYSDIRHCTWPTQSLNGWGGGSSRVQGLAVTALAAASFSPVRSAVVCPPLFSLQCPSLLKTSQTGLLLQCIKERVTCQQTTKCSLLCFSPIQPRHTSRHLAVGRKAAAQPVCRAESSRGAGLVCTLNSKCTQGSCSVLPSVPP